MHPSAANCLSNYHSYPRHIDLRSWINLYEVWCETDMYCELWRFLAIDDFIFITFSFAFEIIFVLILFYFDFDFNFFVNFNYKLFYQFLKV